MNLSESAGESSRKAEENGDVSIGSDRPLKKARFAWQVKGKYHLKNDMTETKSVPLNETDKAGSSSRTEANSDRMGNTEQNLEILGDYLLKQDFNTLDSVITDSDKSLLKPDNNVSTEAVQYPRYVTSNNNFRNAPDHTEDEDHISLPMSMVVSHNFTEDQCIARWQAKQMAKGFIDNTINRVLDTWLVIPITEELNNRKSVAIDIADIINNMPGDDNIENEGILMAISAHGLQNNSTSSNKDSLSTYDSCSSPIRENFPLSPSNPNELKPSDGKQTDADGSSNDLELSWTYNDPSVFSYNSDASSSSQPFYIENNHPNHMDLETDDQMNDNANIDFLDAAISYAIQSRGLTAYETD